MVGAPVSESGYSIAEPVGVPPRRFSARAKIVVTLTPSASAIEALGVECVEDSAPAEARAFHESLDRDLLDDALRP